MNKEKERNRIGKRIADIRREKGITQSQLAELSGMRQSHIARIEAGYYSVGFDTLQAIARALGCQVDFIAI
jgi:transcriptional regulator with XRE-family HTH domain